MIGVFFAFSMLMSGAMQTELNTWRAIVPLRSTCEDVKKVLKVDKCTLPISDYTLRDFRINIEFQNETCRMEPRSWAVAKGTVTSFVISPRKEVLPVELGIDIANYNRTKDEEIVGVERYEQLTEGIALDLFHGFVQRLYVSPTANEQGQRCERRSDLANSYEPVLLDGSQGLVQLWLTVQPKTDVPMRLPSYLPLKEGTSSLYAMVKSLSSSAYEIELATGRKCLGKIECHYGKVSGRRLRLGERSPKGKYVSLTGGLRGWLLNPSCRKRCPDSTLVWDENGYRYTISLNNSGSEELKNAANSAIPHTPENQPNGIRDIDFKNFTYTWYPSYLKIPNAFSEVKLQDGRFEMREDHKKGIRYLLLELDDVSYADLMSDGREEAIVYLGGISVTNRFVGCIFVYVLENTIPKLVWQYETGDRADGGLRRWRLKMERS